MRNKFRVLILICFCFSVVASALAQETTKSIPGSGEDSSGLASEKISLDFKNMDIIDALKMVAASGLSDPGL